MRGYSATHSHNRLFSQSTVGDPVGYLILKIRSNRFIGYICNICFIDHPLAIYGHKYLPGERAVHLFRVFHTDKITKPNQEQQRRHQEIDRGTTIANLYTDGLPKSMLQAPKSELVAVPYLTTSKLSGFSS